MDATIINRRATFFASVPTNVEQNMQKYIDNFMVLKMYPSFNQNIVMKITPSGVVQDKIITLDLKYMDESLKVTIQPDRFDIFSTNRNETLEQFIEHVQEIEKAISSSYNNPFTRLALYSLSYFDIDAESYDGVYAGISKNNEEHPVEWNFRKVLRYTTGENEEKIEVNNVSSFSRSTIKLKDSPASDKILLEIDINTVVGSSISSIQKNIPFFFKSAKMKMEENLKIYSSYVKD